MKKIAIGLCLLFFVCSCTCRDDSSKVTIGSLLREMTDITAAAEYPDFSDRTFSSHDRRSLSPGNPEWFANDDGFGYERIEVIEGRQEKVLFEAENPGAITRIWITTTLPQSTLRFYLDGSVTPDWVIGGYDFTGFGLNSLKDNPLVQIHPNYEKGIKGGQTFFLPIPYAQSCKITLEEPAGWTGIPRYYQIEYREYPAGTEVETFSVESVLKYSKDIREAGRRLEEPLSPKGRKSAREASVGSGGRLSLELPRGSRAVTMLRVKVDGADSASYAQTLRDVVIEGSFDGVKTISVPLSDFSGAGMGAFPCECRQLSADGKGSVTSYWLMPYRKEASFEIVNCSASELNISMEALTSSYRFTDRTLYFHASWHAEDKLPVTPDHNLCKEWCYTSIQGGRGVYVGDNLTLFNASPAWYGEGDEKIYVDSEEFPSIFGTGTEDYYNCSWAPVHVFHTPFGGAPRADLNSSHGYNTFLRTRLLDRIPFASSLKFDIELISWQSGTVDYAATVYWYGDITAKALSTDPLTYQYTLPPVPEDPAKYRITNSYEAESAQLVYISDGYRRDKQDMSGFPDGRWSGGRQHNFYAGKTGDRATLRFNGFEDGRYKVAVHFTKAADYGIFDVWYDGKPLRKGIDAYFPAVVNSDRTELGEIEITGGQADLDFILSGKNPASKGDIIGFDCFIFEKL